MGLHARRRPTRNFGIGIGLLFEPKVKSLAGITAKFESAWTWVCFKVGHLLWILAHLNKVTGLQPPGRDDYSWKPPPFETNAHDVCDSQTPQLLPFPPGSRGTWPRSDLTSGSPRQAQSRRVGELGEHKGGSGRLPLAESPWFYIRFRYDFQGQVKVLFHVMG